MRRNLFLIQTISLAVLLLTVTLAPAGIARGEAGSAYELIDAVNGLRTANGLPALSVDSILMGTAQATSDIMAGTGNCAHIGNVTGRTAAAGFGGGSTVYATENIACGYDLSVATTVYEYWADATHMMPMTNSNYTHIGAGVTVVDGRVYYVVHAAYTSGSAGSGSSQQPLNPQPANPAAQVTSAPVVQPVTTSTPNPDGSVIHEVQAGQALWSIAIAYGIKIADILGLNGLTEGTVLFVGQKLVVQPSFTPTLSPTVTLTQRPPTRTPTITPTPRTPTATHTATVTPSPTPKPLFNWQPPDWMNRSLLGIIMIAVSALGLVVLVIGMFRKK